MLVRCTTTFAATLLLASPVFSHHSDAGIDMDSAVTVNGTVTEFNWRNPHIYFTMETADARGERTEWEVQMGSTSTSVRKGWTRDSLSAGDRVTAPGSIRRKTAAPMAFWSLWR